MANKNVILIFGALGGLALLATSARAATTKKANKPKAKPDTPKRPEEMLPANPLQRAYVKR